MIDGLVGIGPLNWTATPTGKAASAAAEFESLLIGEMLKMARAADGAAGWMGTGDDEAGSSMGEFAEQALAQVLSKHGGFGLRPLIEQGLQAQRETSSSGSGAS
jgi:Rod binding domain-containing protein